jgi:hypothetical protein
MLAVPVAGAILRAVAALEIHLIHLPHKEMLAVAEVVLRPTHRAVAVEHPQGEQMVLLVLLVAVALVLRLVFLAHL